MSINHETEFAVGDKVIINGDESIIAIVQLIQISSGDVTYEVSWFAGGTFMKTWLYEWQLEKVK